MLVLLREKKEGRRERKKKSLDTGKLEKKTWKESYSARLTRLALSLSPETAKYHSPAGLRCVWVTCTTVNACHVHNRQCGSRAQPSEPAGAITQGASGTKRTGKRGG
eukprot:2037913-Rhodomonas_salina.1